MRRKLLFSPFFGPSFTSSILDFPLSNSLGDDVLSLVKSFQFALFIFSQHLVTRSIWNWFIDWEYFSSNLRDLQIDPIYAPYRNMTQNLGGFKINALEYSIFTPTFTIFWANCQVDNCILFCVALPTTLDSLVIVLS